MVENTLSDLSELLTEDAKPLWEYCGFKLNEDKLSCKLPKQNHMCKQEIRREFTTVSLTGMTFTNCEADTNKLKETLIPELKNCIKKDFHYS